MNEPTPATPKSRLGAFLIFVALLLTVFLGSVLYLATEATTAFSGMIETVEEEFADALGDELRDIVPGTLDEPVIITPGKPFTVEGRRFARGWSITPADDGTVFLDGLRLTEPSPEPGTLFVVLSLDDAEGTDLATVTCASIKPDLPTARTRVVDLTCVSEDLHPTSFDTVSVKTLLWVRADQIPPLV